MRRFISHCLTAFLLTSSMALQALAQADAQKAYQEAKAAYEAGRFPEARDKAQEASQTDPQNAEVFLLLGQAHFQLGELDEAIAAWKRTLALAPEEPNAKRMLEVLRRERVDVDARIQLFAILLKQRLFDQARDECKRLVADKGLSDAQRVKIMTLRAELDLQTNRPAEARTTLEELAALYADHADPVQTTLLLGQAKLRSGGEPPAEGIALLKKLVAEHPGTVAAATAENELIRFELRQRIDAAGAERLAKWLAQNPEHPSAGETRKQLIDVYLGLTRQAGEPAPDADLSPSDVSALAVAAELIKPAVRAEETKGLVERLIKHFDGHYAKAGAHAAAAKAAETLLAAPLPVSRLAVLKALARYKTALALRDLDEQSRAGKLPQGVPRGQLPEALAALLAIYDAIDKDYPAAPTWADRAQLAAQVRAFSPKVLPEAEFKGLKGPDAWALDIAMPVIRANADAKAVESAVKTVQAIIQEGAGAEKPGSRQLAVDISTELVEALSPSDSTWPGVMESHAQLLDARAKALFEENLKAGRTEENAKLSELQKQLLTTLEKHVTLDAAYAPAALKLLGSHLEPWTSHGHWAVAQQAYETLAEVLPAAQARGAALAVVNLWIQEVARQHDRLRALGLTVPRRLDPTHVRALKRVYALQGEVAESPADLNRVRGVVDQIVAHYVGLEYFDVAEQAVQVKAEQGVDAADEYAQLQLVRLADGQARRQLAEFLKQYNARERIELTPAFQEVIAGYQKFITDRPASPLVSDAAERVFKIGELFASHEAHEAAAAVYRGFADFAAGVEVLTVSAPGAASASQRAAFAAAEQLECEARKLLARQVAERPDGQPPQKISDEFAAAATAYIEFFKTHGDSPLAAGALRKVMGIALEYAKVGAWEVAGRIYGTLLESDLAIRRPERLEFCRALCQLGQAIPDHAREMLSTLTEGGLRESAGPGGGTLLAGLAPAEVADRRRSRPAADDSTTGLDVVSGPVGGRPTVPTQPRSQEEAATDQPQPPPAAPSSVLAIQRRRADADRDAQLLAMIRNQEANRAAQVAQLRENALNLNYAAVLQQQQGQESQQAPARGQAAPTPVLSDAELARQEKALTAAYEGFQGIRKEHPDTVTADQARGEILVMVSHWRSLGQWQKAAGLAGRFLDDNPTDAAKPKLRLEIARDWLAWASKPIERKPSRQAMLAEVAGRFTRAREALAGIVDEFPKERTIRQQARWDAASSFLAQARVVDAFSPTLARGQYVRAAKQLQRVAAEHPDHPQIGTVPQTLWNIGQELERRRYFDEAVLVWSDLGIHHPMHALAQQAALKIAQTYHQNLELPLRAAEAYQELNFARGGSAQELQNSIYQIGTELKSQKRWVEALHVLEMFVDSFPRHPQAGQALTMIGQIHQTNEAWEDAIAAYRRVIDEFEDGQWVKDAKWAIAECTINLSRWREAADAYRGYMEAYKDDAEKVKEADRRMNVLKDLMRYQALVDEEGQRKAFDAQFQIAAIVATQLSNRVKAIIEYRKVVSRWSDSHLADDALCEVGRAYLALGETEKAREALLAVAEKYPASPLADDALFLVGKSYEDEADKLATVTRAESIEQAKDMAQRLAYEQAQFSRRRQQAVQGKRIADLKKAGKGEVAEVEEASAAATNALFNEANVFLFAQKAGQDVEALTATQLADRQDKINAALRQAVDAYTRTSKVAGADMADEALLQMATIYDQRLKDSEAAMATWLEIVRQFSGTAVAEDASWRIAQTYERQQKHAEAIDAYQAFLRNYRRSPNAGQAQLAVAENYEQLGEWVKAMDSYTNYINNFPEGPLVLKAKEQINWIKTYRL